MSIHGRLFFRGSTDRIPRLSPPAANVAGEGSFFHTAMNPGLFEGFKGRCLRVCESGLDATFGKNPPSLASLDQQEFDPAAADPVTHRSHLFTLTKLPQFREPDKLGR